MLLGSTLAGQAFANSPVAAVHALAYPLGGIFHVPHGLSNALMLSHVMAFNASHCKQAYFELAPSMFSELGGVSDVDTRVASLISKVAALCSTLGLETQLREVGVQEQDIPRLASEAMKQTRLLVNNPRDVAETDALALYQAAY